MAEQSKQFADIMRPDPEADRLVEEMTASASQEPAFIDKIVADRATESAVVATDPITSDLKPTETMYMKMALTGMEQDARSARLSVKS